MGSKQLRSIALEETAGAIAWQIVEADDFDCKRICMVFDSQPAALENVDVYIRSQLGSAYDCLVRREDPNNCNSVSFEDINGIESGDSLEVVYANTGGVTIRGVATVQL
jgi:hypothetical protein